MPAFLGGNRFARGHSQSAQSTPEAFGWSAFRPSRGKYAQCAQRHRGRRRGPQHLWAEPDRYSTRIRQRGDLLRARCHPRDRPRGPASLLAPQRYRQFSRSPTRAAPAPPHRRPLRPGPAESSAAVDSTPSTGGMCARRDWRAAERTTARHRRSPLSTRAPSQLATQRAACQARNASAPASVANSTASSDRSDLGTACTTVTGGRPAATVQRSSTRACNPSRPACSTTQLGQAAGTVAEHQLLARADPAHGGGVKTLRRRPRPPVRRFRAVRRRRTASPPCADSRGPGCVSAR